MYSTILDWNGKHWLDTLLRDGKPIAIMTLNAWSELSVSQYLVAEETAHRTAHGDFDDQPVHPTRQ